MLVWAKHLVPWLGKFQPADPRDSKIHRAQLPAPGWVVESAIENAVPCSFHPLTENPVFDEDTMA